MSETRPSENRNQNDIEVRPAGTRPDPIRYYSGIDWTSLLLRLLGKIHWIALSAVLGGMLAWLGVTFFVTPVYQATSKLYIAGSEDAISMSDIQLGSVLAVDYQEVFKIVDIHEMVLQRLGLGYSPAQIAKMVSVNNPSGSHLLYINAKSSDPQEAKRIADAYAEVVQEYIVDRMELRKPQILETAQTPSAPVSPDKTGIALKSAFGCALAAAAVVVLLFLLDNKIRTSEDVEKATGLATLGMLAKQNDSPDFLRSRHREETDEAPHTARIVKDLALDFAGDEAINAICSNIAFAGKKIKRIAVTSYNASSGKTYLSLRIACSMAARGKTVLLIDADLRKSILVSQYRIENVNEGLAHYLSGQCELADAVYQTNLPGLYLLPAGKLVKTPLPLLTSEDFAYMMDYVSKEFDMVVVDTPPAGAVIDAAEIAKHCDGTLLVLDHNRVTREELQQLQRTMEQTGTPIIGCVINNVTLNKLDQKRYYYQYSYGEYGEGSGRRRKKSKA